MPPTLEVRSLRKSFREGRGSAERARLVLDNLDLCMQRGEFVALVGRSGSGKSTLLHLVAGLDRPDAGEVRICGRALSDLDDEALSALRRESIGFVFQSFQLLSALSVAHNVRLPLELLGETAGAEARVAQLLARVGLEGRGDQLPDRLSGGEQQRVALARALVHRPALVLADEPTGNLDSQSGALVLELLEALTREQQTTLLIATHSHEVARRADRVLGVEDGRLVAARAPA